MRLLSEEEGKCKVVVKKEPSSIPTLRGGRAVGGAQAAAGLGSGTRNSGRSHWEGACTLPRLRRLSVPTLSGANERVSKQCFLREQDGLAPEPEMPLGPLGRLPRLLEGSHL